MGQLNDLLIKAAQPRESEYFLADGEGLYLRVRPAGKVWIYRYKYMGRPTKLSLGAYPTVSLSAARKKAREQAGKRQDGIDPRDVRREEQERQRVARLNTFELTARAWHAQAQKDRQWSASYAGKVMRHLELHIFPWIGGLTMETVAPTELVRCLHRIKERGHLETAQRVREFDDEIVRMAIRANSPTMVFLNHVDYADRAAAEAGSLTPKALALALRIQEQLGRKIDFVGLGPNLCEPLATAWSDEPRKIA